MELADHSILISVTVYNSRRVQAHNSFNDHTVKTYYEYSKCLLKKVL